MFSFKRGILVMLMFDLGLSIKLEDGYWLVLGHFVWSPTKNENCEQLFVLFQVKKMLRNEFMLDIICYNK